MNLPKWVKRNPDKFKRRLLHELEKIAKYAPLFNIVEPEGKDMYLEGHIFTRSNNVYRVQVHFTERYPYEAPISIIMDKDVIDFCTSRTLHDFHNYGVYEGGLRICVIKPDGTAGIGWDPTLTTLSLIIWASEWLHAYEVKRITGRWILPE